MLSGVFPQVDIQLLNAAIKIAPVVVRRELLDDEALGSHALASLALEPAGGLAQGAVWTLVRIQCRQEPIAITVRQVNSLMALQRFLGSAEETGHYEICDCLVRHHRGLLDSLFGRWVQSHIQASGARGLLSRLLHCCQGSSPFRRKDSTTRTAYCHT